MKNFEFFMTVKWPKCHSSIIKVFILFVDFFWPLPQRMEVPGPRIKPVL